MPEPKIIDAHVLVGRNESRWQTTWPALDALGIDTAVLSADPESYDLAGDRTLPGDLSRRDGPYGLWYIGGAPFSGIQQGAPTLPRDIRDFQGIDWHCYFSDRYDYGSTADEESIATAAQTLDSREAQPALATLAELAGAGLPIRITETFPVTVAIISRFPEAVFVVPHMGNRSGGVARVLNALAASPNVYFDTSGIEPNEGMVGTVGASRVVFASGAPHADPSRALRVVRALELPPADVQRILGENARRLFAPKPRR